MPGVLMCGRVRSMRVALLRVLSTLMKKPFQALRESTSLPWVSLVCLDGATHPSTVQSIMFFVEFQVLLLDILECSLPCFKSDFSTR